MVLHALKTALIGDLKYVCQGNEPRLLTQMESPVLGMEIHLSTDIADKSNTETDWIPTRRTRISCALPGNLVLSIQQYKLKHEIFQALIQWFAMCFSMVKGLQPKKEQLS